MSNIDEYIGIPYENGGRDTTGADCFGLVRIIYADILGQHLPSLKAAYTDSEDENQVGLVTLHEIAERWEPVESPGFGDVVVFQLAHTASHIGMMISDSEFIHSMKGRNSCVERISNHQWRNRVYGYYRLRTTA